MLTSILRVRIARFVDNRSRWLCWCMIRQTIEIHLITRFRYNSDENVFFSESVMIQSIIISSKSSSSQKQQKLKIKSEISKIVKRNEFKKTSKAEQTVKSTSTFQNIDIFEYEHIRNHEALKFVKNSHLSINAVNLVCEIEKRSFTSQKSHDSLTKSQKSIFEFAITFRSVTSSELSNLSLSTLKTESKSAKKSATCRHCKQTFKFKDFFRKHKREQHAKKSVINSSLLSHALNLVCEAKKKSAINDVIALSASSQIFVQKSQKIDIQKHSIVNSLLLINTVKSTYEVAEKSTIASIAKASKITSIQKEIELTRQKIQKVEILKIKQRLNELRERRTQREIKQKTQKQTEMIEQKTQKKVARFISTFRDIDIFDSTLIRDIQKFEWYSQVTNFLQHLEQCQHQYWKSDVLALLFKCLREFSHAWFKKQIFIFLQNFDKNLVNAFFISIESEAIQSTSSFFSHESLIFTTSRNLTSDTETSLQSVSSKLSSFQLRVFNSASKSMKNASIQRIVCARTICKRCNQIFNFNNKFHEHIRQHHARKSVISKSSDLRVLALESTYKIVEKSTVICSSASHASSISFATSQSQIFSTTESSRSISFSDSHFSIATLKITSKLMKKLSINCSITFSFSSFRISVRKHHEFHI